MNRYDWGGSREGGPGVQGPPPGPQRGGPGPLFQNEENSIYYLQYNRNGNFLTPGHNTVVSVMIFKLFPIEDTTFIQVLIHL